MDSFALWMQEVGRNPHFQHLMDLIKSKRDTCGKKALSAGDTEFIKGKHAAFKWVAELPDEIIKQSVPDTSEPRT